MPGSPRPELVASLNAVAAQAVAAQAVALWAVEPARGTASRPPGRRGTSRPPLSRASGAAGLSRMVRVSRTSRNRMAAAMVGAACLVGAGVAGGVANGGVGTTTRVVPPVDSLVRQHTATAGRLPFADQTVVWGLVGARK